MKNTLGKILRRPLERNLKKSKRHCKPRCKPRFLTLLEMVIVIGILAIMATLVTFNIAGMFREQRFRTSVELVLDRMQLAQNVMLILNSDVEIAFDKNEDEQYICTIDVEKPLPKHLAGIVAQSLTLDGIETITFNDSTDEITLKYQALKKEIPRGVLIMRSGEDLQANIPIYGYPHPVTLSDQEKLSPDDLQNGDADAYPKEVEKRWKEKESKMEEDQE